MKRDLIIFPKFNNINLIQNVRCEYDKLFKVINPHITIIFPFEDEISNEDLINKINIILKEFKSFKVKFRGVVQSFDNYIFLKCIEGNENIIKLHDEIYENILPNHLRKDIEYIPHITMGESKVIDFLKDFDYEFETIIDKITLEGILDDDGSLIIHEFKLEDE